jgi:hypothetical protein
VLRERIDRSATTRPVVCLSADSIAFFDEPFQPGSIFLTCGIEASDDEPLQVDEDRGGEPVDAETSPRLDTIDDEAAQ